MPEHSPERLEGGGEELHARVLDQLVKALQALDRGQSGHNVGREPVEDEHGEEEAGEEEDFDGSTLGR